MLSDRPRNRLSPASEIGLDVDGLVLAPGFGGGRPKGRVQEGRSSLQSRLGRLRAARRNARIRSVVAYVIWSAMLATVGAIALFALLASSAPARIQP